MLIGEAAAPVWSGYGELIVIQVFDSLRKLLLVQTVRERAGLGETLQDHGCHDWGGAEAFEPGEAAVRVLTGRDFCFKGSIGYMSIGSIRVLFGRGFGIEVDA